MKCKLAKSKKITPPILSKEELKSMLEEQLSRTRNQAVIVGFQVGCKTILDKIVAFESAPGSKSNNDHKRLIKDIKKICEIGLARNATTDDKTEPVEITTQN